MKYCRLTDNDTRLGPITIGERSVHWRPFGVTIESGDEEHPGCSIMLRAFGYTMRIAIPGVIRPWRQWVDTSRESWSTNPRGGYWDVHRREYGFTLSDGFLQVFLGRQTHDSITTQNWCTHLPWTQWRYMGQRWYGLQGELCETLSQQQEREHHRKRTGGFFTDLRNELEARVPKAVFELEDFDGTRIRATTHIEEREWHFGEGWFTWLALFRRPMIKRSLDIEFEQEVGYEKGSWKGGLMGTGINLEPGELHEAAMRRFCASGVRNKSGISKLTFVGPAA